MPLLQIVYSRLDRRAFRASKKERRKLEEGKKEREK